MNAKTQRPDSYSLPISVDVKEHLEYNGEHSIEISVGDAILYPGSVIESIGSIEVSGLKDAPIKGTWSRKYMAKVSFVKNYTYIVIMNFQIAKSGHLTPILLRFNPF